MLTPDEIDREFGPKWCESALSYSYPRALLFELGTGCHPIERFLSAHKRASAVLQDAFRGASDLHVAVQIYLESEAPGVAALLSAFRQIQDCGLPIPMRETIRTSQSSYDNEKWYCISVMPLQERDVPRALWAALGHDFRIEPRLEASVYLMSRDKGILAHPYDDRGMDLIGPNTTRLKEIYNAHRAWLLE